MENEKKEPATMSCEEWERILKGGLSSKEDVQRWSDHQHSCPKCTAYLQELDQALDRPEIHEALAIMWKKEKKKIMARLRKQHKGRRKKTSNDKK